MNATACKTALPNLRLDPAMKIAPQRAVAREHRSIAHRIGVMIRRPCERADGVPEQGRSGGVDHG